jgi:hypothetical protein
MYYRLSYVSRGALPLKTLVLYIYRLRGTMQYNQQVIYSSYTTHTQNDISFVPCTQLDYHGQVLLFYMDLHE